MLARATLPARQRQRHLLKKIENLEVHARRIAAKAEKGWSRRHRYVRYLDALAGGG